MSVHPDYANSVHYADLSAEQQDEQLGLYVGFARPASWGGNGIRYELWARNGLMTWHIAGPHGGAGPLLGWGGVTVSDALDDLRRRVKCPGPGDMDWRRGAGYDAAIKEEASSSSETTAQRHTAACAAAYKGPGCHDCLGRCWCSRCGRTTLHVRLPRPSPLTLELLYEPAEPAPETGCDWPDERDYPGVKAIVTLPVRDDNSGNLRLDLISEVECCGAELGASWGMRYGFGREPGPQCQRRERVFRAATLEAAEAAARSWHAEGVAAVARVLAARETRLAQRGRTIAAAHAQLGTMAVPSE
jgi:hypothetical protein